MLTGICSRCGKTFTGRSKPRWVFTRDDERRALGLMHASCTMGVGSAKLDTVLARSMTEEQARFVAWTSLADRAPDQSARRMALVMAWDESPSLDTGHLSANQAHWLERFEPQQRDQIRIEYDVLLGDFREWLQRNPPR